MIKTAYNWIKRKLAWFFVGGTILAASVSQLPTASIKEISLLQENYYSNNGRYLQILSNNTLSADEQGTVKEKLGKNIANNIDIDIYESPKGWGYQIKYEDNLNYYSFGYGPEAESRTWTKPKPAALLTATSTMP